MSLLDNSLYQIYFKYISRNYILYNSIFNYSENMILNCDYIQDTHQLDEMSVC